MEFERIIKTKPPFDKRHSDPKKNYGVGSTIIWFILKGKKGAIQFQMNTGGYLEHIMQEWVDNNKLTYSDGRVSSGFAQGWDLGYHALEPQYDGQTQMDCDLFEGGKCYYDGTSLGADRPLQVYLQRGEKGLWEFLEEEYNLRFNGKYDE